MEGNGRPRLAGESRDLSLLVVDEGTDVSWAQSLAFIVPSWQIKGGVRGEIRALASAILEPGADAFEWFRDMEFTRPWESRH